MKLAKTSANVIAKTELERSDKKIDSSLKGGRLETWQGSYLCESHVGKKCQCNW